MIVIDASVAIKCVLPEDGSEEAQALFAAEACLAPDLIFSECMNVLWKNAKRGTLTRAEAEAAGVLFGDIGLEILPSGPLSERALSLALSLDHPAYDCFYLALAEARGLELVTMDKALVRKVEATAATPAAIRLLKGNLDA